MQQTKYIIFLTTIVLLLFIINSVTAQISEQKVLIAASNYSKISFSKQLNNSKINGQATAITKNNTTLAYVVSIQPKGYVILSADERITPIIGFSTEANFDFNQSPDNHFLEMLINDMSNRLQEVNDINISEVQINSLNSNFANTIENNKSSWIKLSKPSIQTKSYDVQYGPLLKSIWGGVNCYDFYNTLIHVGNYYTPHNYSPGCVATATSIVMNYFEWPPRGEGYHTDYDNTGSSTGSYYANFGGTEYLWGRMLDKYYYKISKPKHHEAMGELAYHVAIAVDMNFEHDGSSSNLNRTPAALNNFFRFTSHYKSSSWNSFWPRTRANIRNGYPVTMAISKTNGEGHAMVCDGYGQDAGQARFYHLDFGWWGNWNGWYNIQGSWDASDYKIIDGATLDILPIPMFDAPLRSENEKEFIVPIMVGKNLSWDSFKIWESFNGGSYSLIESSFDSLNLHRKVTKSGLYRYKVQAKINGGYYNNSISEPQEVLVGRSDSALVSLDFDGNDSYFIKDNYFSDLDIKKQWTIETWVKVNSLNTNSDWDVLFDREGVFSLYLIEDNNADYAIRFVTRSYAGSITSSLRSDSSDINLNFDKWVHIAISYDSTKATLFVNGTEVQNSNNIGLRLNYSTKALNIGARYWGGYSRYLVGELDEIRISDTARYFDNFVPYRCMPFDTDDYTRLLLHLDEESGDAIGDASRHFFNTNLRSSPNSPNWIKHSQKPSVIFKEQISAKSLIDSAIITWTTEYEAENVTYELRKCTNVPKLSSDTNWTSLAIINGTGDSLSTTTYSYTENLPPLGRSYYQLFIINNGCKFFYTAIDSINVVPDGKIKIYPIPASQFLKVHGMRGLKIDNISIYDINGRYIEPKWRNKKSTDAYQEIDIRGLAIGMYFLKIEINGEFSYRKFIIGG